MDEQQETLEKVDDTEQETLSEEQSADDTFELPTVDPESSDVVEKQPEQDESGNWEKRYKDLQSQKDKEVAEAHKKASRYEKLLAPFEKDIVDRDGELAFEFPDTPETSEQKAEGKIPEPVPPNDDEWATDPTAAGKKLYAYERYVEKQQEAVLRQQDEVKEAGIKFKESRAKSWEVAQTDYPDLKDQDSALYKHANDLLLKDPYLDKYHPNADYLVAQLAASHLGITPAGKETQPLKKDGSYIITKKSGASRASSSNKLTESEFSALTDEEQHKYMEREILGT
jgi:hypothetical protein